MIDIRSYDMALVERIKMYFNNTHWIQRTAIPLKDIRDRKVLNGTDIELPIITVRRTNCPIFKQDENSYSRLNTGLTYTMSNLANTSNLLSLHDKELADKIENTGYHDNVAVVNALFTLTYYIDVISLERDNFDAMMVELQENLFRNPYIDFMNFKAEDKIDNLIPEQACHLFVDEIEDTSDLENFDSGNALFRGTITVHINAYIYRKYKRKAVEQFHIKYNTQAISDSSVINTQVSIINGIQYIFECTDTAIKDNVISIINNICGVNTTDSQCKYASLLNYSINENKIILNIATKEIFNKLYGIIKDNNINIIASTSNNNYYILN